MNVGKRAVCRHFLVVRCPRQHLKTHAEWRKTSVNSLFYPLKTPENTKIRDVQSLRNGGEQRNTIRLSCVDRMFSVYFACISRASTVRLTPVKPYFLPWPAFIPIFDRGLGRVSKWHARGKSIKKKSFWNLHRDKAIRSRTWCDNDEAWMSFKVVQHNIDYQRPQWGLYVRLNNSCTAYVLHLFKKNILKHFQKKLLWKIPLTFLFYQCFCRSCLIIGN